MKPRVTVNWGLRYDFESMPSPQIANPLEPRTGVFPSDKNNWGPRIGVNWDVTGKGDTVLRGGYGMFYGRIINSTISNAITNTGMATGQLQLSLTLNTPAGVAGVSEPPRERVGDAGPAEHRLLRSRTRRTRLIHQFDSDLRSADRAEHRPVGVVRRQPGPAPADLHRPEPESADGHEHLRGQRRTARRAEPHACRCSRRPGRTPTSAQMTQITSGVNTSYNALVLALNRRFTEGLQVQTSYTYSRATDNGQSSQTFTTANNVLESVRPGPRAGAVQLRRSAPLQLQRRLAAEVDERVAGQLHDRAGHRPSRRARRSRRSSAATRRQANRVLHRHPRRRRHEPPAVDRTQLVPAAEYRRTSTCASRAPSRSARASSRRSSRRSTSSTASTTRPPTRRSTRSAEPRRRRRWPTTSATFNTNTNANNGTFSPRPREIQLGVRYTF